WKRYHGVLPTKGFSARIIPSSRQLTGENLAAGPQHHLAILLFPLPLLLGSQIFFAGSSATSGDQLLPLLIIGAPFNSLILSRNCAARSNSRFLAASSISSSSRRTNSVASICSSLARIASWATWRAFTS